MNIIKEIKSNYYEICIKENILHIINYIKILKLSNNRIEIELENKQINIDGNNLIICSLNKNELLIKGSVENLKISNKNI